MDGWMNRKVIFFFKKKRGRGEMASRRLVVYT